MAFFVPQIEQKRTKTNEYNVVREEAVIVVPEPRRKRPEYPPNRVLLYTIINPKYPITTDVINTISSPYGQVNRIVIFRKKAVQAMVEFDNLEMAKQAKEKLHGADIYAGCCTLKVEYAKPLKLNVYRNNSDSWDYTAVKGCSDSKAPLLPEPPPSINFAPVILNGKQNGTATATFAVPCVNTLNTHEGAEDEITAIAITQTTSATNVAIPHVSTAIAMVPQSSMPPPIATSPVLMVYDLDPCDTNCDKLFNLFCLYGNVVKIKFLKTKSGCAMVQMHDAYAVDRCVANLNPVKMLNGREMSLGYSKQAFLSDSMRSYILPDGSEGLKDYSTSKNNRFSNHESAAKNRIQPPGKILHFYNTPTNIMEEQLTSIFNSLLKNVTVVANLKIFPRKEGCTARCTSGLVEFASVPEALHALMNCNHQPIAVEGVKFPYIMKLCFSSAKSINLVSKV